MTKSELLDVLAKKLDDLKELKRKASGMGPNVDDLIDEEVDFLEDIYAYVMETNDPGEWN